MKKRTASSYSSAPASHVFRTPSPFSGLLVILGAISLLFAFFVPAAAAAAPDSSQCLASPFPSAPPQTYSHAGVLYPGFKGLLAPFVRSKDTSLSAHRALTNVPVLQPQNEGSCWAVSAVLTVQGGKPSNQRPLKEMVKQSGNGVLVGPLLNLHTGEVVDVFVPDDTVVPGSGVSKEGFYQTAIQTALLSVAPFESGNGLDYPGGHPIHSLSALHPDHYAFQIEPSTVTPAQFSEILQESSHVIATIQNHACTIVKVPTGGYALIDPLKSSTPTPISEDQLPVLLKISSRFLVTTPKANLERVPKAEAASTAKQAESMGKLVTNEQARALKVVYKLGPATFFMESSDTPLTGKGVLFLPHHGLSVSGTFSNGRPVGEVTLKTAKGSLFKGTVNPYTFNYDEGTVEQPQARNRPFQRVTGKFLNNQPKPGSPLIIETAGVTTHVASVTKEGGYDGRVTHHYNDGRVVEEFYRNGNPV